MGARKKRTWSTPHHVINNMDNKVESFINRAASKVLHLDDVRSREAKENADWTTTRVDAAVAEYRKWLVLIALNKFGKLGMCSADVDKVWHAHILFTRKYAADCEALCGRFIHHQPTSEEEKLKRDRTSAKNTRAALLEIFGEVHPVRLLSGKAGRFEDECDECSTKSCQSHDCTVGDCQKINCTNECKSTGCEED